VARASSAIEIAVFQHPKVAPQQNRAPIVLEVAPMNKNVR